ncbi:hypothetical protein NT01EI_3777 [Edwardsiella ictaluri 93-146]|uniref:Uncharacterized protein n=1 Tax=Edwardsiella ictaluri (strain 93-146) TaxID=634503 RepID=C5BB60_EDWI9|nr:hypothetical protein NT01EI_3777 [Edwardsiella ictaluri 93-146]
MRGGISAFFLVLYKSSLLKNMFFSKKSSFFDRNATIYIIA